VNHPAQEEAIFLSNSSASAVFLYHLTVEEWDAYLEGRVDRDELHERVDRRRAGREPLEPPGGSRQASITRWCD
jgi:hypothetical protein